MAYVIGCLMAALSFILNQVLLKYAGRVTVISYSPLVEEGAKTLFAYYMGADIVATHITFGLLEACYDWINSRENGVKAAVLSIGGHSMFGLLTYIVLIMTESIWLGLALGLAAHLAWNVTVIRNAGG